MTRMERDSMGEVALPEEVYWGAETQRAVENFPISGIPLDRRMIWALGTMKEAAAAVNERLNMLDERRAAAIRQAASEVAAGGLDAHFPVDVFQTGSGTSSNMNANEVIAHRANELLGSERGSREVHPNDHVNLCQSSNDVFPSAIHLAVYAACRRELGPALSLLAQELWNKSEEHAGVVKAGRTHLMDATPITLGQEFGGWAAQVRAGIERIEATFPRVGELAIGGTAVGTGINAPPEFARDVIRWLRERHEDLVEIREARDHFEAQGARDAMVELSGALRTVAISMFKIANDLRWLASGPRTGLAEIQLPELQPGSSIMPGKINPVIPEAVCQVCAQVIGNDAAVAFAGASGNLELNVMMPVIARNVIESITLLSAATRLFAEKCVMGIRANQATARRYAELSMPIATALVPLLGHDVTADVARQAMVERTSVREVVLKRRLLDTETLDRVLNVETMTQGGLQGEGPVGRAPGGRAPGV